MSAAAACLALLALSAVAWAMRPRRSSRPSPTDLHAAAHTRPDEAGGGHACANRYAWLLGREVEARLYEGRGWERYVVVAVGWHGSICVRRAEAPDRRGWWVKRWAWEGRLRVDGEVI